MKPRQKVTILLIGLLVIASLISACSPAAAATAPAAPATEMPAKVEAPKPALDLNAKLTDFVTNLPDGCFLSTMACHELPGLARSAFRGITHCCIIDNVAF